MRRPWRERRGGGKRGRRVLGESRSRVVPPRNHRRRRPLVWKNDSSVLTECPCFCPPPTPSKPLRGWLGERWVAGVGSRYVGGETRGLAARERETRCLLPIPLSPRHSCVCLYEDLSNSPPLSLSRSLAFPSPPLPSPSLFFPSVALPRVLRT